MSDRTRILLLLPLLLLPAGCGSSEPPLPEPYDVTLSRWIGQPEASMIAAWGVPTHTQNLAGGGQVLEWDTMKDGSRACATLMTTDPTGKIIEYHFDGSDCRPPGH